MVILFKDYFCNFIQVVKYDSCGIFENKVGFRSQIYSGSFGFVIAQKNFYPYSTIVFSMLNKQNQDEVATIVNWKNIIKFLKVIGILKQTERSGWVKLGV